MGLIAGYIGYRAMHAIDDYNLEILITLAVVMVTYSFAIYVEMSGPIAMVVAGLFIGDRGIKYAMSEKTRKYVIGFWSLIDEILNAVLFLLIGLEVLVIAGAIEHLGVALLAIPATLFARALSVYILMVMLSRWQSFGKGEAPVLIWGGLRGGIAVALALSLAASEYTSWILNVTFAVVLFSIIVQGLTVGPLIRKVIR